jgi:hypothetical protein
MCTKVAILAFYLRIFSVSSRARTFIWIGIVLITLGYLASTAATIFYMVPYHGDGSWGSPGNFRRLNDGLGFLNITLGGFGVVTDTYVIAIPTVIVWRLHLPPHKKIGVACVFLIGFV